MRRASCARAWSATSRCSSPCPARARPAALGAHRGRGGAGAHGGHGAGGPQPGADHRHGAHGVRARARGQRVRIIGEPIWAGRSDDEYPACAEHEALINVALGEAPAYILCPYDVRRLEREWLTDATRTHPTLAADGDRWESPAYTDPGRGRRVVRPGAPPAPPEADVLVIGPTTGPRTARGSCTIRAAACTGSTASGSRDVRLVAQELAVNTVMHSPAARAAGGLDGGRPARLPGPGRRPDHRPAGRAPPARTARTSATGCSSCTRCATS